MAIKLTCPGCRDAVQADESDRGKKIKCGTCWTDVPVPAPVQAAKAAPLPTAKAVPAAPVVSAKPVTAAAPAASPVPAAGPKKATPLPAAAPAAKPVVAAAIPATAAKPAAPTAPKPKAKDAEPESKKSRFKERDGGRDDDDDDDTPRNKKKGGGGGVMIAFICIGAVMLLGVAGGIAVIVMNGQGTAAATTTPTTTSPTQPKFEPLGGGGGGGGGPIPPRNPGGDFNPGGGVAGGDPLPPPKPPAIRPQGWAEYKGKDFTCDMPGAVNKAADKFVYATREVTGSVYTANDQNSAIKVTVKELVLPAGTSATSTAFVAAAFAVPEGGLKKDAGRLVSGNDGVEYKLTTADGDENAIVAVGVGTKNAFLFRYQWKPNTPTAEEKRDNFLASLNVLLEGEAPVVRGGPVGGQDPKQVRPITVPWKPLENKDGFSVEVPTGVKKPERHVLDLQRNGVRVSGKKWTVDDEDVTYHVYFHDLPPDDLQADLKSIAEPLVKAVFPHGIHEQEDAKVDGKPAVRWVIRHFHGGLTHGVSVHIGYRVFTLFVTSRHGIYQRADATVQDREDRFLNSIKFTFDPKTHNPYADEPEWVAMAKAIGFTALIPKQATSSSEFKPFFFDEAPKGREWKADVDGILYQVFVVDFSPRPGRNQLTNKTPQDLVDHLTNKKPESGPEKSKLGTLNAEAYTVKVNGNQLAHLRFVANGNLVYAAKVSRSGDWNSKCGDKEFADKTARFFDAFRLGEGVIAPGPGGVGGVGGGGVGSTGEFAKLGEARVQPFWAGVFLPLKKEFVTFGVKDPTARPPIRGVVRRYSVPDFKLKATYETASPINRVSADETNGRLFAATVQQAADAKMPEKDNLIAIGDVQQYDLLKLTDGSLTEGERVTPTNVIQSSNSAFRVSGLEAAADGSAVYISGVTVSGKLPNQVYRGKLLKWDTATRKMQDDIATDLPVWALAVSADGKKVIAVERNMDPAKAVGNVIVVDGPGWKKLTPVPLLGVPWDVAFRGDRVAVVVSGGQAGGRLLVGPVDGDLSETTPGGEINCVRYTPGGTKLLVSAGIQSSGLTMYEVDAAKPPKLTKVAAANELGGLFVISPDGKIAVTNTGAVLDLEKSKAK
jgi:hypothetical protein